MNAEAICVQLTRQQLNTLIDNNRVNGIHLTK